MTNVAIIREQGNGRVVGIFHAESKAAVLSLAKSSMTLTYHKIGELVQVGHSGTIDSGVWLAPDGTRLTVVHHVSYGSVNHL
jgi:hypothetical protein